MQSTISVLYLRTNIESHQFETEIIRNSWKIAMETSSSSSLSRVYIVYWDWFSSYSWWAHKNIQRLAIFWTFWFLVQTKLHLTEQIVSLFIIIIIQNSNLTVRLIISREQLWPRGLVTSVSHKPVAKLVVLFYGQNSQFGARILFCPDVSAGHFQNLFRALITTE